MNSGITSPIDRAAEPGPTSIIDELLADQHRLATPAQRFSRWHDRSDALSAAPRNYSDRLSFTRPADGEQYAFEVNLDQCTACKACVTACHSLNGLDDDESWRDVGFLTAEDAPYGQSVTTACHHCVDPACLNGCPVLAYEKDAVTGIVRHLDDQCIGCSYCIMKCPYDAPKFNRKRGIVRKCDMCSQRLAVGEAPACVQACPNDAIQIRIVKTSELIAVSSESGARLLPGAVDSNYTIPTTRYVTARTIPAGARPDDAEGRAEPAHFPLVILLVLTQWATGCFLFSRSPTQTAFGLALVVCGLAASVMHLGQPLKAWRAFLGWRRSWLSREIIAFTGWPGMAAVAALGFVPAWAPAGIGLCAVACSVMVYADTRRPFWALPLTAARFFGTVVVLGAATTALTAPQFRWPTAAAVVAKLAWESVLTTRATLTMARSNALLAGSVGIAARLRLALAALGAVSIVFLPPAGLALLAAAEFLERFVFFRAAAPWRMPGTR
jgi:formate dehydrogenase iron-sulfur subunit